jgi:RNA recognition motif-containing protein
MLRGDILQDIDESLVIDHFSAFAPVKDIRMVRNRATKRNKDFAFIEFHTQEEAELVIRTLGAETTIHGQPILLSFSKAKRKCVGLLALHDFLTKTVALPKGKLEVICSAG